MPNVGLFTANDPLKAKHKVVIRFSVEVDKLPVYNESYDVDTLRKELEQDPEDLLRRWAWRLLGTIFCRDKKGFSACLTRSLTDGQGCACGHSQCEDLIKKWAVKRKQRNAAILKIFNPVR